MGPREQLQKLIEALPEHEVIAALRFVQYLRDAAFDDPVAMALLAAPETEEGLSSEEIEALDAALEQARTGQVIPSVLAPSPADATS